VSHRVLVYSSQSFVRRMVQNIDAKTQWSHYSLRSAGTQPGGLPYPGLATKTRSPCKGCVYKRLECTKLWISKLGPKLIPHININDSPMHSVKVMSKFKISPQMLSLFHFSSPLPNAVPIFSLSLQKDKRALPGDLNSRKYNFYRDFLFSFTGFRNRGQSGRRKTG
jgi:hypothetical protein